MGSLGIETSFHVLEDTRPNDSTLPAFMVSTTRGFLPRVDPIIRLPKEFDALESLLTRMPVKRADGEPGLLAHSLLGDAVRDELKDLTGEVEKYHDNQLVLTALYRDYSFLASAYLLEPCHERFLRGEGYGLARDYLPVQISRPISRCAELSGFKPWMEYAGSYALFNYRLVDPAAGMEYSNLRLIRAFEHGMDPTSSEAGFVLVHIDMVRNSGPLVAGAMTCLDVCSQVQKGGDSVELREVFNAGLEKTLKALTKVNGVMETMWAKSKPREYTSFRTFIFGITSQSMFPNGVVYEGVNDNKPMSFRGESGANDTMIPLMDNLLQVPMPETPLTEILRDFREYRPSNHRSFLNHVKEQSLNLDVKGYALKSSAKSDREQELATESRRLWLKLLDQVRDFRWRHWCFAREYILKMTSHPTATGGSPIVTWLPNQLAAVLEEMEKVAKDSPWNLGPDCGDIMDLVSRQKTTLQKEVEKYCAERGVNPFKTD